MEDVSFFKDVRNPLLKASVATPKCVAGNGMPQMKEEFRDERLGLLPIHFSADSRSYCDARGSGLPHESLLLVDNVCINHASHVQLHVQEITVAATGHMQ